MEQQAKDALFYQALIQYRFFNREESIAVVRGVAYFPDVQERAFNIYAQWAFPQKVCRVTPELLPQQALKKNVEAISIALSEDIQRQNSNSFCLNAFQKIYARKDNFSSNTQLYKHYYDKLKVSDVLEVIGYALESAKQFSDLDTAQLEKGLLVLKSIDLALNNKPYDRPDIKSTHLVVDILSSLLQKMTDNHDMQKCISGGATIVKLAIKFFRGN